MPIFELYSRRQKKLQQVLPDVYTYDSIPEKLRVQICHIMSDAIGEDAYSSDRGAAIDTYARIYGRLCREFGVFELVPKPSRTVSRAQDLSEFLMNASDEEAIDAIEVIFFFLNEVPDENYSRNNRVYTLDPEEAFEELNCRFKEHLIGFEFLSSRLIRIDSQLAHSEIIKPTLILLSDELFSGANDEFLNAHTHYRNGLYKECLVDCFKSFESSIKSIALARGWELSEQATVKTLVDACFTQRLIPTHLTTQFGAIRSFLESVATPRNKNAAHGQGSAIVEVSSYVAKHALNMTATGILFLVDCHQNT